MYHFICQPAPGWPPPTQEYPEELGTYLGVEFLNTMGILFSSFLTIFLRCEVSENCVFWKFGLFSF